MVRTASTLPPTLPHIVRLSSKASLLLLLESRGIISTVWHLFDEPRRAYQEIRPDDVFDIGVRDIHRSRRQWKMKTRVRFVTLIMIVLRGLPPTVSPTVAAAPVNPDASPEARALLNFIKALYGKRILSGQMWAPWGIDEIKTVQEITGKLPAIRG